MSLRAIFRFENLDSTKDLNDRFKGLFSKGIYNGGTVSKPVFSSGANYVTVSEFSAMSFDGMAVISDSDINVVLKNAGTPQYIILVARYNLGEDPTLELMSVTNIDNYPDAVKLCKIVGNEISYGINDRDVLDKISRNHYKGIKESELGGLVEGDFYFLKNEETQDYDLILQKSEGFETFISASVVNEDLNRHRLNSILVPENTKISKTSSSGHTNGYWNSPNVSKWDNDDDASAVTIANTWQTFGSYHISINKWFALENINMKWTFDSFFKEWRSLEYLPPSFNQLVSSADYDLTSFDLPWNNNSTINTQVPGINNRFITQNYPLIPDTNEKQAMVGNFSDNKPSTSNPYLTKKTAGIKRSTAAVTSVSPVGGYYYYPINNVSKNIYIGADNYEYPSRYLKYFGITPVNMSFDEKGYDLYNVSIVYRTSSQDSYHALTSSQVNDNEICKGRFLKEGFYYFIKSPVMLSGNIYYYEQTEVDNSEFSIISDSLYKDYSVIDRLFISNKILISGGTQNNVGTISVASNGNLVYSYNNSDNEVLLRDKYAIVSRLTSTGNIEGTEIYADSFNLRLGPSSAKLYVDNNTGDLKFKKVNNEVYTVFLVKES